MGYFKIRKRIVMYIYDFWEKKIFSMIGDVLKGFQYDSRCINN